jgi:hypothetical protein
MVERITEMEHPSPEMSPAQTVCFVAAEDPQSAFSAVRHHDGRQCCDTPEEAAEVAVEHARLGFHSKVFEVLVREVKA